MKDFLVDVFLSSVGAAHPSSCLGDYLQNHLPEPGKGGKLYILASGKASGAVAVLLDDFFQRPENRGRIPEKMVAVTRNGDGVKTMRVEVMEAGHPFPDDGSVRAADYALDIASQAGEGDIVWVILSGGASAMWCAPVDGLDLTGKQMLTQLLLKSGASINDINAVRTCFSRIKGGGLGRTAGPAKVITTAISDVVGDDPAVIGSGVTIQVSRTRGGASRQLAKDILDRFDIDLPPALKVILEKQGDVIPINNDASPNGESRNIYHVLASGQTMLDAAQIRLEREGYEVINLGDRVTGEAREVAREHAGLIKKYKVNRYSIRNYRKLAVLSGGELTVTVKGTGRGGSSQEYALALAIALEGQHDIYGLAADSDGVDGGEGKVTDPAGAFIDPSTLARAASKKLSPATFLENNDSEGFFRALEDLVLTGFTGTNVNDFRLVILNPSIN